MLKTNSYFTVLVLLLLLPAISFATTFTSQTDGDWDDPATWGELTAPQPGDDVIIQGHRIFMAGVVDIDINSLLITNASSTDTSKLDIRGNFNLNIATDLTMTAEDVDEHVQLIVRETSIVNVGGNMLIQRANDNSRTTMLQLKMYDSGQLFVTGTFNYNYKAANNFQLYIDIWLFDDAYMTVGELATFLQEGGGYLSTVVSGGAILEFSKGLHMLATGGIASSVTVSGTSNLIVADSIYIKNSGGSGATSLNANGGGTITSNGVLSLVSTHSDYKAKVYLSGDGTTLDLNGDLRMTAASQNAVEINTSFSSSVYLSGNIKRPTDFGAISMTNTSNFYYDSSLEKQWIASTNSSAGSDEIEYTNLHLNNSAPDGLELDGNLLITTHLSLTKGIIKTHPDSLLIIDSDASSDVGNALAYVDGPMTKRGTTKGTDFTFPLGNNGIYAPITIEAVTSTILEYTAQFIGCPPPTGVYNGDLKSVNQNGHWILSRNDADKVGDVRLHWGDDSQFGITDINSLVTAYYNPGSGWFQMGRSGASVNGTSGSIKNDLGCPPPTGVSIFTFGSLDENENALPVELTGFRAFKNSDQSKVFLEWETVSEENSDYFIIEKSYDGANFHEIAQVQASQNSTSIQFYSGVDDRPNKGNNYYRIQMVDQNRLMSFSNLINVFMSDQEEEPTVFPNPVKESLRVYSKSLKGQDVNVKVLDATGRNIYSNVHKTQDGQIQISNSNMRISTPGIYFITYEDAGKVFTLEFLKVN